MADSAGKSELEKAADMFIRNDLLREQKPISEVESRAREGFVFGARWLLEKAREGKDPDYMTGSIVNKVIEKLEELCK